MPLKLAMAWVGLQVLFFAGWAGLEERRHHSGDSILVRTLPVDPRDLLSGQYMTLSYDFTRRATLRDAGRDPQEGEDVWVVLRPDGPYHTLDHASLRRPADLRSGQVALLGRSQGWRTVFGVEKYFVPEGTETPAPKDTTVRLRVGKDGIARIEQVLVFGKPWPSRAP